MTDSEIIKALRFCSDPDTCSDTCSFYVEGETIGDCTTKLSVAALDLIQRQQEQIKALIAGQETLQKHFAEEKKRIIEQLEEEQADSGRLYGYFKNHNTYQTTGYQEGLNKAIDIVKGVQDE